MNRIVNHFGRFINCVVSCKADPHKTIDFRINGETIEVQYYRFDPETLKIVSHKQWKYDLGGSPEERSANLSELAYLLGSVDIEKADEEEVSNDQEVSNEVNTNV